MVLFIEETKGLTLGEILPNRIPISEYLQHIDLYLLVKHLEDNCYEGVGRHFRHDPLIMLKLVVVKLFRKFSYRDTVLTLTDDDCRYLALPWTGNGYAIPARSTLHHFVKYRLKEEGFERLMEIVGTMICRESGVGVGIMDSTPLEASRYDNYAEFNPHYNCKMDKAHIFHIDDIPVFCCYSGGTESDSKYAFSMIKGVEQMKPKISGVFADGGYDSFQTHADIHQVLRVNPYIDFRDNAVINEEGEEERIDHWVNKLWKKGGSVHATQSQKLEFLYKNGRQEQVGMYLRNQNLRDPMFRAVYKKRGDCERTHNNLKSTVKFDVRKLRNSSKKLYVLANFVAYQILLLGHLQNNIRPVQQLALYY